VFPYNFVLSSGSALSSYIVTRGSWRGVEASEVRAVRARSGALVMCTNSLSRSVGQVGVLGAYSWVLGLPVFSLFRRASRILDLRVIGPDRRGPRAVGSGACDWRARLALAVRAAL
jgi:hypothetical protein